MKHTHCVNGTAVVLSKIVSVGKPFSRTEGRYGFIVDLQNDKEGLSFTNVNLEQSLSERDELVRAIEIRETLLNDPQNQI